MNDHLQVLFLPAAGRIFLVAVLATLLGVLVACGTNPWAQGGGGGDDDDSFGSDDDDAVGDDDGGDDDDATSSQNTASYPQEEAWFALAVGNTWRFEEQVIGDVESKDDDVLVTVVRRIAGEEMDPLQSPAMVVFELEVDRLFGQNEVHWYGLDGSGSMQWVKSRLEADFLESTDYPGDGSTVARYGTSEGDLLGSQYQAIWLRGNLDGHDYSATTSTIETFFYGDAQEVETLGNQVFEDLSEVGIQYVKPGWGLLGQTLTFGSSEVRWTITECSPCPPGAGL